MESINLKFDKNKGIKPVSPWIKGLTAGLIVLLMLCLSTIEVYADENAKANDMPQNEDNMIEEKIDLQETDFLEDKNDEARSDLSEESYKESNKNTDEEIIESTDEVIDETTNKIANEEINQIADEINEEISKTTNKITNLTSNEKTIEANEEVVDNTNKEENQNSDESLIEDESITTDEGVLNENILGFEDSDIVLDLRGFKETLNIQSITPNHFRFEEAGIRVDFMLDDLTKTPHKAYNNSVYSAGFIQTSDYTSAYEYDKAYINGHRTHIYTFERRDLKYGKGLMSHFAYIEVELESQVLLSLHIASGQAFDPDKWINRLIAKEEGHRLSQNYTVNQIENSGSDFEHDKTQDYFNSTFIESEEVTWGIFEPSTHYELDYVHAIEEETGIDLDIILEYYDLGYMPRLEKMKMLSDDNKVLELTFQTSKYGNFNADALYEVLDGKHDATIDELIGLIKAHDEPVLFRPNNEMNGDWCTYNAMYTHKDAQVFRVFWKWLHDRFEAAEVENVIWVWNPNWGDFPYAGWNDYMNYFPGENYVDVIGLTGYNTGTYYEAEEWRSFLDIYLPMLWEYDQNFKGFPYMITEFGSSSTGGDKGQWIKNAFDQIETLNIKAAVWWNHVDYDTQKGVVSRGYKFDDDPEVMEIFKDKFYK